jgi:glutamate carboxypeptidase
MLQTSSTYAQTYLPLFHSYQDEYLRRLETLVNIDSGTGQVDGIEEITAHLKHWLTELDFTVTLHPTDHYGPNLVARRQGKGTRRVLLVGHIDTVYNAGTARSHPFRLHNDRAYGPGVSDMKSGVLAGIYAARALIETGFEQYGEMVMLWNNDEEVGSPASKQLICEIAQQVDVALVLEPSCSQNHVTVARKGADKYILDITGVPAHSGVEPHKGRSAVLELAHKIVAIHNLHTIFPNVSFNVTRISSNERLNIVPDQARCWISVRAFSEEMLATVRPALEQLVLNCSVPGTRASLTLDPGRRPYESTPEIMRLFSLACEEGETLGLHLEGITQGGVSDGNFLMEAGIPTLDGLGLAGIGDHNLDLEHVLLDALPLRGALLAGLIQRICVEA